MPALVFFGGLEGNVVALSNSMKDTMMYCHERDGTEFVPVGHFAAQRRLSWRSLSNYRGK